MLFKQLSTGEGHLFLDLGTILFTEKYFAHSQGLLSFLLFLYTVPFDLAFDEGELCFDP
jgi:hypothetical protein